RLVNRQPAPYDSPTILIGGTETYEARCRRCHEVPVIAAGQTQLFQDQHS
ncbi:MAG: thymidine kinase, partial [Gemmatimonadales bacterium]